MTASPADLSVDLVVTIVELAMLETPNFLPAKSAAVFTGLSAGTAMKNGSRV